LKQRGNQTSRGRSDLKLIVKMKQNDYRVSSRGDLVFEFFEIDLAEALTGKFQKSLKLSDGEMIQIQVSESTNTKFHLSRVIYDF